jgi:hypothetical protein
VWSTFTLVYRSGMFAGEESFALRLHFALQALSSSSPTLPEADFRGQPAMTIRVPSVPVPPHGADEAGYSQDRPFPIMRPKAQRAAGWARCSGLVGSMLLSKDLRSSSPGGVPRNRHQETGAQEVHNLRPREVRKLGAAETSHRGAATR